MHADFKHSLLRHLMYLKVWLNNKFKDLPVSPYLVPIMMDFVVRMQVKCVDVLGGVSRYCQ